MTPFNDLMTLMPQLPSGDAESGLAFRRRISKKAIGGAGGGLVDHLVWLAEWQGKSEPSLAESHICVLASAYKGGMESESLKSYIDLASKGQALVNHLCKPHGLGLRVLEMAVEMPHHAGLDDATWSEAEVMGAVAFGMEATASEGDMLGLGDLAYGNESYAIAILSMLTGMETGLFAAEAGLRKAAGKAQQLINRYGSLKDDPLALLRALGGREMAGSVGAIIAARSRRLPVILDGWAASAAAAILYALDPSALDHCKLAAPLNDAHQRVMGKIGLRPVVGVSHDCAMGVGAAMAINLLKANLSIMDLPDLIE